MEKEENLIKKLVKGPSLGYTDVFSKRELWEEIAKETKGEFKISHTAGKEIEIHNIIIPYDKWKIEISASDTRPLKFMISFKSLLDFEMILSREDFIDRVMKKFGNPEPQLGWEEFDKKYLIKTDKTELLRLVITREIQQILLKYNVYSISYQPDADKKTAKLLSVIERHAGDKAMILELITMFKLLADNLKRSGIVG
jgi:hypothetical protein